AVLHDAIVLAGGRDNLPRFENIVRAGLFDVHVLTGLAGPDGLKGMMVVGSGDGYGVDTFVFEDLADVGEAGRLLSAELLHGILAEGDESPVYVTDRGD